jgi:hypothetical protein
MNKIAEKRRRFGYRRIGVLLERKGMVMNEKKLYRIYREEGLSVRLACCRFRGHEDKIVTKESEIGHGETEVHEGVQV